MVYSFNFNKTTVDETKQSNFENEPNIEMIRRMNKNAPREYNCRYPNNLLKPEKEKQRNVVDVNVKITSTLWLLDKKQDYVWDNKDKNGNAIKVPLDPNDPGGEHE